MNQSTTSDSSLLPEREWEKLFRAMSKGEVVPIIGPELLSVPWNDKPSVQLYDLWGKELQEKESVSDILEPDDIPQLYKVANRLFDPLRLMSGDLESDIYEVVCSNKWPTPQALRQLAEIDDFTLYITTTIDHLLYEALTHSRPAPAKQITFRRGGDKAEIDLPSNFATKNQATVYYMFGAACIDPGAFAATEDALLDFSWDLIDRECRPNKLYDFLKGKELLLLGCNFPDWLARFFIHALTTRSEFGQTLITYVSSYHPRGLQEFLQRKQSRNWPTLSPAAFVAELHRRWQREHPTGQAAVSEKNADESTQISKYGAVFISYAREDKAIALRIKEQLENAGIDTWMDESGLESGVEFQRIIRDNIERAAFFLAIISRALDLDGTNRPGRFVLKEWHWAEDVNLERRRDDCFLQPVVVDDTPPGAAFIDSSFRKLHWTTIRDKQLPPEFITMLGKGIRRFRGNARGVSA